jgi:hypothetical protein
MTTTSIYYIYSRFVSYYMACYKNKVSTYFFDALPMPHGSSLSPLGDAECAGVLLLRRRALVFHLAPMPAGTSYRINQAALASRFGFGALFVCLQLADLQGIEKGKQRSTKHREIGERRPTVLDWRSG